MADLLVVGGIGVDTVVPVPALPVPERDIVHVGPIRDYVAHAGNGVAQGCAALGLDVRVVDILGDDLPGELIRRHYLSTGVPAVFASYDGGTPRSVNLVDPAGRRLSLHDPRRTPAPNPDPALWRAPLRTARNVYVSLADWARPAADEAVAAKIPVIVDLHTWDGRPGPRADLAYTADLVFLSDDLVAGRVEAVAADVLAHGRARAVVVMAGAAGSYVAWRDGAVHVPAIALDPAEVVDTNGAGDSYLAAFVWAWLAGRDWPACGLAGSYGGAYAARQPGTHTGFITPEELPHG